MWKMRNDVLPVLSGIRVGHHDLAAQLLQVPGDPLGLGRGLEEDPRVRLPPDLLGEAPRLGGDPAPESSLPSTRDANLAFLLANADAKVVHGWRLLWRPADAEVTSAFLRSGFLGTHAASRGGAEHLHGGRHKGSTSEVVRHWVPPTF
jgi:hypothetical protein